MKVLQLRIAAYNTPVIKLSDKYKYTYKILEKKKPKNLDNR